MTIDLKDLYGTNNGINYSSLTKNEKVAMAINAVNTSRYDIVGVEGRSTRVIVNPRFHNIRNKKGRFTRYRKNMIRG